MQISGKYQLGEFIERPNRFIAKVKLSQTNQILHAHVADPGRLKELFKPAVQVYLKESNNPKRKTQFSLVAIKNRDEWININSIVANKFIAEKYSSIQLLKNYNYLKAEYTYGKSRLDFLLKNKNTKKKVLVEVKSVTLKIGEFGFFPDAPTKRGTKHVFELIRSINDGYEAIIIFVMKRKGVKGIKPYKKLDPEFASALELAHKKGVLLKAFELEYKINSDAEEFLYLKEHPVIINQ